MSRPVARRSTDPSHVATFRRSRKTAVALLVVAAVTFFVASYAFAGVRAAVRGQSLEPVVVPALSPDALLPWVAVGVVLVGLVVGLHELLHGVFLARYGGDPAYGVGLSRFLLPYAYAGTEGTSYARNQLLVALLAPFVGITLGGIGLLLLYPSPLIVLALAANAAGSVGDLWMATHLLQYPARVRIAPLPDGDGKGFGIYAARDRSADRLPERAVLARAVAGAVGTVTVVTTGLAAAVFLSLAVGSGTVVVGEPGSRWFLFRHQLHPPGGGVATLEVGASAILALGAVGGLAWPLLVEGSRRIGA